MARGHGRILASIWEDSDFIDLDPAPQRMYLFLISQPNLNHAGLLPLTLKRWSRKAKGLTVDEVERVLAELAARRFVVIDEETEELLIRTFVRNDGVWKQPKVMAAMVSGAQEISSPALRRALLAEMDALPLDELSNVPGPRGASVRQQVDDHLAALRQAIRVPEPAPTATVPHPSAKASESLSDTPAEPFRKPSESPPEATTRAHASASRAHSPAPAPAPTPELTTSGNLSQTDEPADDVGAAEPPDPTPSVREDVEQVCLALAEAIEANGSKRPNITGRWRNEARLLIDKDGRSVDQVLAAIAWCQADNFWRGVVLSMPKLREKYDQLRLAAQRQPPARSGSHSQQAGSDLFDRARARAAARAAEREQQEGVTP